MKKLAKIVAGLVLGLVVVAGVKTEAKAYDYADLLRAYAYYNGNSAGISSDYANLLNAFYGNNSGYYSLMGYNPAFADNSAYGNVMNQYLMAYYSFGQAQSVLSYYTNLNEQFKGQFYYLTTLEQQMAPYAAMTGGTNPITAAKYELLGYYAQAMSYFQ